jgi:hypothetical protein
MGCVMKARDKVVLPHWLLGSRMARKPRRSEEKTNMFIINKALRGKPGEVHAGLRTANALKTRSLILRENRSEKKRY